MAEIGYIEDVLRRHGRDDRIRAGLEYLAHLGADTLAGQGPGYAARVDLEGEEIFALHQVYVTKDREEGRYEAHRKHIDLQFLVAGEEQVFLAPLREGTETVPYDAERDVAFYEAKQGMELVLRASMVAIFYPEDLHAPCLDLAGKDQVKKVVVKIRI